MPLAIIWVLAEFIVPIVAPCHAVGLRAFNRWRHLAVISLRAFELPGADPVRFFQDRRTECLLDLWMILNILMERTFFKSRCWRRFADTPSHAPFEPAFSQCTAFTPVAEIE
jgi:hypothetical protein